MATRARDLAAHADRADNPHTVGAAQAGADPAGSAQAAEDFAVQRGNHTGTQTLATISDAGSAASRDHTTSQTDNTLGRLMRVGDFGIGADNVPVISDFTVDLTTGVYRAILDTAVGGPETLGYWYSVFVVRNSAGHTFHLVRMVNGTNQRSYTGSRSSFTGSIIWQKNYDERNILGTVSQSGGIPTGAIIESGSNANGDYTKFADGTMICRQFINFTGTTNPITGVALYYGTDYSWFYPGTFNSVPDVTVTGQRPSSDQITAWAGVRDYGVAAAGVRVVSNVDSGSVNVNVMAIAVGRWF